MTGCTSACADHHADERREHDERHHARLQQREVVRHVAVRRAGLRRQRIGAGGLLDRTGQRRRHLVVDAQSASELTRSSPASSERPRPLSERDPISLAEAWSRLSEGRSGGRAVARTLPATSSVVACPRCAAGSRIGGTAAARAASIRASSRLRPTDCRRPAPCAGRRRTTPIEEDQHAEREDVGADATTPSSSPRRRPDSRRSGAACRQGPRKCIGKNRMFAPTKASQKCSLPIQSGIT